MAKGKLPRTRDDRGPYKGKQKAAEPRYDTLDDALEAGVEAEEKGERFSVGPKAQRCVALR